MAKPSKLEEYWRQNNIENLLKDVTRVLAQRMPSDPVVAIVQHLQKKFPKSFRTSTDSNNNNTEPASKTMVNTQRSQSIISNRSDSNRGNVSDIEIQRRASNQSQVSGIVTIPTAGSAFTKPADHEKDSFNQAPEINLRNLVFASRLSQQAVKLGKDIRSDHEILEDELIKPTRMKENVSSTTDAHSHSISEDLQHAQIYNEPSMQQLIRYKQRIRTENDRRLHREKLAELARQVDEKERILLPDLALKPDEIQSQQKSDADYTSSDHRSEVSATKSSHKPIVKSKEEEDVLNDENVFQPGRQRNRERYKNKSLTSRTDAPYFYRQSVGDLSLTARRKDGNTMDMIQFGVCKVCGNIMNNDDLQDYSRQVSAEPTARSIEPQPLMRSVKTSQVIVDDWFESASGGPESRQVALRSSHEITSLPMSSSNSSRQNLFQPNNENSTDTVQHRPPSVPSIPIDDKMNSQRSTTTTHSAESDIVARTSSPKLRYSSSSLRHTPSPATKKHQSDVLVVADHQLSKTATHSRPNSAARLPTTLVPTTERRMSGWSVREHSPDDSDENEVS